MKILRLFKSIKTILGSWPVCQLPTRILKNGWSNWVENWNIGLNCETDASASIWWKLYTGEVPKVWKKQRYYMIFWIFWKMIRTFFFCKFFSFLGFVITYYMQYRWQSIVSDTFYYIFFLAAQDILQGLLQQGGPCFEAVKSSACGRTLVESFNPRNPNVVNDEPRTLAFLFTPRSPEAAELLHDCGGGLATGSTYDPDADTEIFIHGWLDGVCRTAWMRVSFSHRKFHLN